MITRITGTLEEIGQGRLVLYIAEQGVAREALAPPALLEALTDHVGQVVTLHTIEHYESVAQGASFTPRLLAFASREDKRFFELLTKVKGLGVRKALRSLAAPTGRIAMAIAQGDAKYLATLPEIGKKLAETIVVELRAKAGEFAGDSTAAQHTEARAPARDAEQAIIALVRLGESRAEAERMVRRAIELSPELAQADAILAAAFAARGA